MSSVQHSFRFDPRFRVAGFPLMIRPQRSMVRVDDVAFTARLGPWTVATPVSNVAGATVTGPFALPKVIGPPHVSLRDGGLTFATNPHRGVCVSFNAPVTGLLPFGLTKHPSLTVTVDHPDSLADLLNAVAVVPVESPDVVASAARLVDVTNSDVDHRRPS